jgi:hypothetical protein
MSNKDRPIGTLILGGINCYFFGIFWLIISIANFLTMNQEALTEVNDILKNNGIETEFTLSMFKTINVLIAGVALIFFTTGLGLLKKKEWARKVTIYFSLAGTLLYLATAILYPGMIKNIVVQFVYFGILIFYFTNKKVEVYFNPALPSEEPPHPS